MGKLKYFICGLIFILGGISAQTVDIIKIETRKVEVPFGLTYNIPVNYPQIALVLSGGGARGLSQVGVIKSLNENNIFFEGIIGTSMGSIVGGLYSSGYSISEMEKIALENKWDELIYLDGVSRKDLFVDQKLTEDKAFFSIQLEGLKPIIPNSWNSGSKISSVLNGMVANAPIRNQSSFSKLLYKFKAVCTDLENGRAVVIEKGSLARAMRASSSFSLLLPPVKFDSLLLADGGLVANIPVKIAKKSGYKYIIAVNSTSPLHSKNDLKYPWHIADQAVSIPMQIINSQNLEDADFILEPNLNGQGNNDFSNVNTLIEIGYQYTQKNITDLKNSIKKEFMESIKSNNQFYNSIRIQSNNKDLEMKLFNKYSSQGSYSKNELIYDLSQEYLLGNYNSIECKIDTQGIQKIINIKVVNNPEIESVSFEGINEDNFYELTKIITPLKNKLFNTSKVLTYAFDILKFYRDNGNILAKITRIDFNERNKQLSYIINEGVIDSIEIRGRIKTDPTVISRELTFKPGEVLKVEKVKKSITNLFSTNLFNDAEILIEQSNDKNILVVQLEEKVSRIARFGLRLDNEYATQVMIDVRDENLAGSGTELGATFLSGIRNRTISFEHKSNRIFDTYLTYKLKGYFNFTEIKSYEDDTTSAEGRLFRKENASYRESFSGISIGVGTQVERFGNLFAELRYEKNRVQNLKNFEKRTEDFNLLALKLSFTVDSQDDYPFPTSGFFIHSYYETAQQALGSYQGYSKFYFDYDGYFSVSNISTFCTKLKLGFADMTLPLTQHFSFGGQNNFFGYREYEFRGRQIFTASLEYRLKLPIKLLVEPYLKFRYDIGSIWPTKDAIRFKDLRHGIGASLSFNTPIGPADFSVGQSFLIKEGFFDKGITFGPLQFYFTIGYYY